MRILMIAPVPFFEPRGTPISILERLRVLSTFCHNIDLVTYHVGEDIELENVTIHRTPKLKHIKQVPVGPSLIKLLLDLILSVKVLALLIKGEYNLIHSNEEGALIGAIYSRIFRIPHLYDCHSSLPDVLENFGYKRYLIFKRVLKLIERLIIRNSDAIITISPGLTEYVRSISKEIPIVTIENIKEPIDLSTVSREDMVNTKKLYSINKNNSIVLYTGTFENYQGLDLLLSSAKLINNFNQDIIFILAGGDKKQVELYKKKSLDLGLNNHVYFTGKIPQEEILVLLKISDVLVSTRIRGMNPPLKIYSYLQSGKPIVATNIIAHTQVLNSHVACLVKPEAVNFSDGIMCIIEDKVYAKTIAKNAKDYYKKKFSQNSNLDKLKKIISVAIK